MPMDCKYITDGACKTGGLQIQPNVVGHCLECIILIVNIFFDCTNLSN